MKGFMGNEGLVLLLPFFLNIEDIHRETQNSDGEIIYQTFPITYEPRRPTLQSVNIKQFPRVIYVRECGLNDKIININDRRPVDSKKENVKSMPQSKWKIPQFSVETPSVPKISEDSPDNYGDIGNLHFSLREYKGKRTKGLAVKQSKKKELIPQIDGLDSQISKQYVKRHALTKTSVKTGLK